MEIDIKDNGEIIWRMDMVNIYGTMGINIRDVIGKIKNMDMG